MLRFDLADRRRVVVATAITVIALPSLWLMNRGEGSAAPNVATAGVAVAPAADAPGVERSDTDPMGGAPSPFLDGPARTTTAGTIAIAIPATDPEGSVIGTATFRSTGGRDECLVGAGGRYGAEVTVTNLDNSRSTTCRVVVAPLGGDADVVLHAEAFAMIADLTDAPVPVEIDW